MTKIVRTPGPGQAQLKALIKGLQGNYQGRAGWFESAKYPDGTPVAYVATIQEFGYAPLHIPPRMGLRELVKVKRPVWQKLAESGVRAMAAGNTSMYGVMEGLGLQASGDIAKRISEVYSPPLKPATVRARAEQHANFKNLTSWSTKPLVDSGLMISSVSNDVIAV